MKHVPTMKQFSAMLISYIEGHDVVQYMIIII